MRNHLVTLTAYTTKWFHVNYYRVQLKKADCMWQSAFSPLFYLLANVAGMITATTSPVATTVSSANTSTDTLNFFG